MALVKQAMFAMTAAVIFALVYGEGVDSNCLRCLCEAISGCKNTTGCSTNYRGQYFCGPFHISRPYWADADKPILAGDNPEQPGAFERCVQDLYCGAETVRRYMAKFLKTDCNLDDTVDCHDYVYIHINGGHDCKNPAAETSVFYRRFLECWDAVTAASPANAT